VTTSIQHSNVKNTTLDIPFP